MIIKRIHRTLTVTLPLGPAIARSSDAFAECLAPRGAETYLDAFV